MSEKLYMKVTDDKFELPVFVASTARELAAICGVKTNSIFTAIGKAKRGEVHRSTYCVVELDDEEGEENNDRT